MELAICKVTDSVQRLVTLGRSSCSRCRDLSCLKSENLWKPEGAAKRPHSKAGWNQSSLAKQWRPNPAEARLHDAATGGHEIKLAGETGEVCGRVTLPIGTRHGSRDGQTVIVESEILSINTPTVT
jgi:hypothetical protein